MVYGKKTYKNIFYGVDSSGNEYWGSWEPKSTLKEAKELYRKEIRLAKNSPEFGPFTVTMYRIDEISGERTMLAQKRISDMTYEKAVAKAEEAQRDYIESLSYYGHMDPAEQEASNDVYEEALQYYLSQIV